MTAKLITTASDKLPPLIFRKVIVQVPALMLLIQQLYAPDVAPEPTFKIITSLALIKLLVNVKVTLVNVLSVASFIVIWPMLALTVTPVDLLVPCVTAPCAPEA